MKKIILLLVIMVSLNATKLHAQNGEQMQQAWKEYLKDSMKLADPMVDSVMAVRAEYRPQMREIFMDQSASAADKQTKFQTLRAAMDIRYKAAGLTDEQIQAIHEHEDRLRAEMMAKMNNGNGGQ
jgi:hypothetical protein